MNDNLTVSALAFNLKAKDLVGGSERREISRGVSLPEIMTIKSQDYVDSSTKIAGVRTVLRFDRHLLMSTGVIAPVSAYLVVTRPKDTGVVTADVQVVVERIVHTIQEDDSGLNLADNIFVNGEL